LFNPFFFFFFNWQKFKVLNYNVRSSGKQTFYRVLVLTFVSMRTCKFVESFSRIKEVICLCSLPSQIELNLWIYIAVFPAIFCLKLSLYIINLQAAKGEVIKHFHSVCVPTIFESVCCVWGANGFRVDIENVIVSGMKNAGDACSIFLISLLCSLHGFSFALLLFTLQIVLSVLWQTGKKFIAGNLQMYPRVGGKGGWGWGVFGDRFRGYATEITAATHRFQVTFPQRFSLSF